MPSISELARYPYTGAAVSRVKDLDFKIDELNAPEFASIINRAKERVENAIRYAEVQGYASKDEVELLSFPAAIFLISCLNNEHLARRYALAEAKRAYKCLLEDGAAAIMDLAKEFTWRIERLESRPIIYRIYFTNYLSNSAWIKESKYRLINRRMDDGLVSLTRDEAARLLQEEVRLRIEHKVTGSHFVTPENLKRVVDYLERLYHEMLQIKSNSIEDVGGLVVEAVPPCIRNLNKNLASGKNLSHVGRFYLTSFLLNIGLTAEEILEFFKGSSDFDLKMASYQVEHIGGLRGSGRRYIPPKCSTLKTHGLCQNPDDLCSRVNHPLGYYRRKLRSHRGEKG